MLWFAFVDMLFLAKYQLLEAIGMCYSLCTLHGTKNIYIHP